MAECDSNCGSCKEPCDKKLKDQLARIKEKIVVLSGKGGVGKSTVSVNLAVSLALSGKKVGLLDVDIHGPSIPTMLGLEGWRAVPGETGILPHEVGNLKVMSIGFLLENQDDPVIWRGPMKMGVIKQFISDVEWGDLDCLVIDSPPGTGDEPLSVCQLISDEHTGAVIVTTPQRVAAADVRKSINFCVQIGIKVLGLIENMSGFACPDCGKVTAIFDSGKTAAMAEEFKVPLLGTVPIDPAVCTACDAGTPFIYHFQESAAAKAFEKITSNIFNEKGKAS